MFELLGGEEMDEFDDLLEGGAKNRRKKRKSKSKSPRRKRSKSPQRKRSRSKSPAKKKRTSRRRLSAGGKKPMNAWTQHVRDFYYNERSNNPEYTYTQAMKDARESYYR